MRRSTLLTVLLDASATTSYEQFLQLEVAAGTLPLWYRMRETSGTVAANSGSAGAAMNGTISGTTTLGQTDVQGANDAFLFDALTSTIALPNHATIQNLSIFTIAALVRADGYGEGNAGTIVHIGSGIVGGLRFGSPSGVVSMSVDTDGTDAVTLTLAGAIPLGVPVWVFGTYDDTGDRKCRLYKGQGGVVTEMTYGSQVAATGTRVTPTASSIGNFGGVRTWQGLIGEVPVSNVVRDTAWLGNLVRRTPGV